MKFLILILLIFTLDLSAAIIEFDGDFGYDKQVYGTSRQNSFVSRTYSAGVSVYLFDLTAVDLNFSNTEEITSQNDRYTVQAGIDVVAQQNRVDTNVYGIGIKQMLAGRGSRIVPMISVGYGRQLVEYQSDLTWENTTTKAQNKIDLGTSKERLDSVFGTFQLQLKLTDRLSLKGAVKTLFPAFEFNKAKDNLKYSLGFSWLF